MVTQKERALEEKKVKLLERNFNAREIGHTLRRRSNKKATNQAEKVKKTKQEKILRGGVE